MEPFRPLDRGANANPASLELERLNVISHDSGSSIHRHSGLFEHHSESSAELTGNGKTTALYSTCPVDGETTDRFDEAGVEPIRHVLWKGLPRYLLTWDLLGVGLSICFLGEKRSYFDNFANSVKVLGICVVRLTGKEKSTWSVQIIQATLIAPSVWPIAFSGILGNALRSFADWRVERGISLMVSSAQVPPVTPSDSMFYRIWSSF
jgi:hypothetical protein